jgi:hypothetical protein
LTKSPFHIAIVLCLFASTATSQITGIVRETETALPVIGASVVAPGSSTGVMTDIDGRFAFPGAPDSLVIQFIGFEPVRLGVRGRGDVGVVEMRPNVVLIEQAAEVEATAGEHLAGTTLGRETIAVEAMETLPALLGEVDPLKVLQLLPGVQSAGEGNTGFYVRGGGPDQNLLLLDNAVVYNASHLLGFFSVFNADALQEVDLIKGAMPAQYGGRVSSVLSIGQRAGDMTRWRTRGGLGLISSRLTVEGPLVKDRMSLLLSARRTYLDLLLNPFLKNGAFAGTRYFFQDFNGRLDWKLSDSDQISLSAYHGRDAFAFNSAQAGFDSRIPWGNSLASLNWRHIFNDRFLLTTTGSFTAYDFSFEAGQEDFRFGFESGVKDWAAKSQLTAYSDDRRHTFQLGVEGIRHDFRPTDFLASSDDVTFDTGTSERAVSHELAAFLSDGWDVTDAFRVEAGVRLSEFRHIGPFIRFRPDNDPAFADQPDSIVYAPGVLIGRHGGLEPRLATRLTLGPRTSLKAGWSRNLQYIHLVSLSATSLPADIWLPSTERLAPQRGEQWSLGTFYELPARKAGTGGWSFSVEGYWKTLEGLPAYRENIRPEDNIGTNVDNNLVVGRGWSYGVETFAKRKRGALTGWIGYTWSKTERQFDDLNSGNVFPARFDRRHDLSVVLDWKVNEDWRVSGTFVYATGNAITLPASRFLFEGRIVEVFGPRNGYRMAPYHRADLGATWSGAKHGEWRFSIYNLYSRLNPYFIYFDADGSLSEGSFELSARQVSLFPILPSISWNFDF